MCAILEKEGDQFPQLRDRFYRGVIEPGMRDTASLINTVRKFVRWARGDETD